MKKLLTLVMALALVFTCFSFVSAEDEITKITWVSGSSAVKDNQMILDYLNEHFLNAMGIELDIQYYDSDATLRTDINNGTVFDIYFTCSWYNNTNQAISDGLFVGLDPEVIKEEAPGLWAALPESVWETGYGVVYPDPSQMQLAEPQIVRQNGKYSVHLKASAPAIHMMMTQVETEVSPAVGGDKSSEAIISFLLQGFDGDVNRIWESNIFGRSLNELAEESLRGKIERLPEKLRMKLCETLQRMINESSSGMLCLLL